MTKLGGDAQLSQAGAFAPLQLQITVNVAGQGLLAGAPITFTADSLGGALSLANDGSAPLVTSLTVPTNGTTGIAQVYFQQPTSQGTVSHITARSESYSAQFSETTLNLVGFWRFDENNGTSVLDSSPTSPANNGVSSTGCVRVPSFGTPLGASSDPLSRCPSGNGMQFDGTGSIQVASSTSLAFSGLDFSVLAWVVPDSSINLIGNSFYPIVSKYNGTQGFSFGLKGGAAAKGLSFVITNSFGTIAEINPASDCRALLANGSPHLIGFTRTSTGLGTLYIDGVDVSTVNGSRPAMSSSLSNSGYLLIGKDSGTYLGSYYYKGVLEDVRLYSSCVPVSQLAGFFDRDGNGLPDWWEYHYFGGLGVDPAGDPDQDGVSNLQEYLGGTNPKVVNLAGFWRFDEAGGGAILDSSPAVPSNPGTLSTGGYNRLTSFGVPLAAVPPVVDPLLLAPSGNELQLTGSGYVQVPASTSLAFVGNAFSVFAWVLPDPSVNLTGSGLYPILAKASSTTQGFTFALKGGTAAKGLSFAIATSGGTVEINPATDCRTLLSNGTPHLIGFTRDSGGFGTLYIDGVDVSTANGTKPVLASSLTNSGSLWLGKDFSGNFYTGILEDVRLYACCLAPPQIGAFFDRNANGLPDWWDYHYFGLLGVDPTSDPDHDGINNLQEYLNGTGPQDFFNGTTPTVLISSGDQQMAAPNTFAPLPLTVEVRNSAGQPLPNAPVTFLVSAGNGQLASTSGGTSSASPLTVTASSSGPSQASIYLLLPQGAGDNVKVTAVSGPSMPTAFTGRANGLSTYLRFNETSGIATDSTGHSRVGTLSSTLARSVYSSVKGFGGGTLTLTNGGPGADNALYFGNPADQLTIANASNDVIPSGNTSFSISMWVRAAATSVYGSALTSLYSGALVTNRTSGATAGFSLQLNNGFLSIRSDDSGGTIAPFTATQAIVDNRWHNVVLAYNGTGAALYLDGVSVGTAPGTVGTMAQDILLGNGITGTGAFSGTLDEVKVFRGISLSAAQVLTNFTSDMNSFDPDHDGLTNDQEAYYGTGPNVADTNGNGINDGAEVLLGHSPTATGMAQDPTGTYTGLLIFTPFEP